MAELRVKIDVDQKVLFPHLQSSPIGKRLPGALYLHYSALHALDPILQAYEHQARSILPPDTPFTLIKFNLKKTSISYLHYPHFDTDPHPALHASTQINLTTQDITHRNYTHTQNPPILHRKETFLTPDHPNFQTFATLTRQQEALGLLSNSRSIGTRKAWDTKLNAHRVIIQDHQLIPKAIDITPPQIVNEAAPLVHRHKAAISRNDLSKPVRLAVEARLLNQGMSFFDYGCGQGGDVERVFKLGYETSGWDPHYRPDVPRTSGDIVNLGYVINVVECQKERRETLLAAWQLTQKVLIVAAQVLIAQGNSQIAYGDGIITSRNTFQKYYDQEELKIYIDQVLGVDAVPVALGIYFVFRDEAQAQSFRASRFRSRVSIPRVQITNKRFEDYKELLSPLMAFHTERGRLPTADELPEELGLKAEFGSLKRAFQIVLQATNPQEWDSITDRRRQDLLVYLALTHFGRRPRRQDLAPLVQNDIKALFGNYQQACIAADLMLMSLGNLEAIEERCQSSPVGQKRPNSLWVHVSAIEALDPLLRLYEGCASRTIGRPQDANVIKFHFRKPKISYLFYPDFEIDPHPALQTTMQIDLRDLHVYYRDHDSADNPLLLHQKNLLVVSDYPYYEKFAKLTQQEKDWGLLDDLGKIRDRRGWNNCLKENCAELKGHRVVWKKGVNPYQIKLIRSKIRAQKKHQYQNLDS